MAVPWVVAWAASSGRPLEISWFRGEVEMGRWDILRLSATVINTYENTVPHLQIHRLQSWSCSSWTPESTMFHNRSNVSSILALCYSLLSTVGWRYCVDISLFRFLLTTWCWPISVEKYQFFLDVSTAQVFSKSFVNGRALCANSFNATFLMLLRNKSILCLVENHNPFSNVSFGSYSSCTWGKCSVFIHRALAYRNGDTFVGIVKHTIPVPASAII